MNNQLVIVKPGTLKPKDKEKLTKQGFIVIEHEKAHEINYHTFKSPIPNNDEYTYTNCYCCGERIYLLRERLAALKSSKKIFYCSHGHSQAFT